MVQSTDLQLSSIQKNQVHFQRNLFQKKVVEWFWSNRSPYPWRQNFKQKKDPYPVWVSEIMLQQTTIQAVLPVYSRFMLHFPDVFTLAKATTEQVRQVVKGLGYYRRFAFLHKAAQDFCAVEAWQWPQSYSDWLKVAGVGDYTASAIASIVFNEPKGVLDGNVERVFARLFDLRLPANEPRYKRALRPLLDDVICPDHPGDFNEGLMEIGQRVCLPQNPICQECPLQKQCLSYKVGSQDLAPGPKIKKQKEDVEAHFLLFKVEDKIGLVQRDEKSKFLKEIKGFPFAFRTQKEKNLQNNCERVEICFEDSQEVGKIKHSITHHKISATVHVKKISKREQKKIKLIWVSQEQVEACLVSSFDSKVWKSYLKSLPLET